MTAGLVLLSRLFDVLGFEGPARAIAILSVMTGIGGVVWAFRTRPSQVVAARAADRSLGLRARLGTAAELIAGPLDGLAPAQIRDAQLSAAAHPADRAMPPIGLRDPAIAAGLVAIAIAAWIWLPDLSGQIVNPFALKPGVPIEVPIDDQAKTDLARNNVNDLVGSIEEIRKRLAERSIEPGEAARLLAQAEARLNQKMEASSRQQKDLQNLADALRSTAAAQDVAGSIDRGDYGKAADQLNDIARDADQLSAQAKRELAQALDRAAQQSSQNPGLRDAERRASQALNRGDYKDIERSFRNMGDQIAKSGQEVLPQSELGRAAGKLDQAKQEAGVGNPQDSGQDGSGSADSQAGNPVAGGNTPGNTVGGSLPGNAPGQNLPSQGSGQAPQGPQQDGQQNPTGAGTDKGGDYADQEGPASRLNAGGAPVQIESPDSGGSLRPGENKGDPQGMQVGGARPAAGNGVAQPTDPVDSTADFTRVAPDRRPGIRGYFNPGGQ